MEKAKITLELDFTLSKIMGILIILGGIALGFYLKSESVVVTLTTVGAGMITVKTIVQKKRKDVQ